MSLHALTFAFRFLAHRDIYAVQLCIYAVQLCTMIRNQTSQRWRTLDRIGGCHL